MEFVERSFLSSVFRGFSGDLAEKCTVESSNMISEMRTCFEIFNTPTDILEDRGF